MSGVSGSLVLGLFFNMFAKFILLNKFNIFFLLIKGKDIILKTLPLETDMKSIFLRTNIF